MIVQTPCAIKDCPKMARVEDQDYRPTERFALCYDCQTAVVLDVILRIDQDENFPKGSMAAFVSVYNGWVRKRKGTTLSHKSGSVSSTVKLGPAAIIRGN